MLYRYAVGMTDGQQELCMSNALLEANAAPSDV